MRWRGRNLSDLHREPQAPAKFGRWRPSQPTLSLGGLNRRKRRQRKCHGLARAFSQISTLSP